MTAKRVNQIEDKLSPEIITLLQSDTDGIHFMFKPNTLLGGMERDGIHFVFGEDLTLPCGISQLAEWLLFQRNLLESNSWEGRNAMLNWLNGIMHSKPLAGAIKKAEAAKKEAGQRENQFLVEEPLSEEDTAQQVEWDRCVSGMEYWENVTQLTPHEFCCLRHIHDPRNFEQEKNTIPSGTGNTLEERVADDERIIERDPEIDGKRAMSLAEWVTWAEHKNWAIPGFISRATENPTNDGGSSAKPNEHAGRIKNEPLNMVADKSAPPTTPVVDTQGWVLWQVELFDHWEKITNSYGRQKVSAHLAIRWLRENGTGVIQKESTTPKKFQWIGKGSKIYTTTIATAGNVISGWRREGLIPKLIK